jgi:hypothetical protein
MDVLLTGSHLLGGRRVRLRLARSRDLRALAALLRAGGHDRETVALAAARLVRFDPRRRAVVCATALLGGAETIVGVAALDVGGEMPQTLCVDPALGEEFPGLGELLTRAVRGRIETIERRSAA